jgi:hypothetical protein
MTSPASRHATHNQTYRESSPSSWIVCVTCSPTNSRTAKTMPIGMPIANSFSTSRRKTTAIRQTATVTQNKATGNQPEMIEMLPTCPKAAVRANATTTAIAVATDTSQRQGRDGDVPVVCWFVVSVWVLIVECLRFSSAASFAYPDSGLCTGRNP